MNQFSKITPGILDGLYNMSRNRKIKEKRWSNNAMKPDGLYFAA